MIAVCAGVAQWLEHHSYKVVVEGSIPSARTFISRRPRCVGELHLPAIEGSFYDLVGADVRKATDL
jgi:hypothetical protein